MVYIKTTVESAGQHEWREVTERGKAIARDNHTPLLLDREERECTYIINDTILKDYSFATDRGRIQTDHHMYIYVYIYLYYIFICICMYIFM